MHIDRLVPPQKKAKTTAPHRTAPTRLDQTDQPASQPAKTKLLLPRPHHQSSSSSFLAIAFFRASSASASEPARLGVGVLLRLLSDPPAPLDPARLIPESRGCSAAGFLPGRAGGVGAAGLARPLATGGGGGARGAGAAACSST